MHAKHCGSTVTPRPKQLKHNQRLNSPHGNSSSVLHLTTTSEASANMVITPSSSLPTAYRNTRVAAKLTKCTPGPKQ
ncbi:hypothetical protein L873DRAFT_1805826 [Choiromyces venosus 120613-1]|uniref:Uncharacterized protein n=1 Tax=Choiromyces venosus 120613-1 TaxID=1336337 RepID=A0A3N4JV90_9PEZI|nr:hypothetical protein L873DRAFT_1805826 [Choiromyces venosus 120613-1]